MAKKSLDARGFREDLDALRARTFAELSSADYAHLRKMERWGRALTFLGYASAWLAVNPISIVFIGLGITTRWMLMHHVAHGGYDRVPGIPARYTRKRFAVGSRRWLDWLDWIEPEAWRYEHNQLHHYHTSEPADPDLVDRTVRMLRANPAPRFVKLVVVFFAAATWKATYYAATALNGLTAKTELEKGAPHRNFIHTGNFWDLRIPLVRRLWVRSIAPYFLVNFVVAPLLFLPLGRAAVLAVLVNRLLAELFANLQTYLIIVPSHAASDLMAFEGPIQSKDEFYVRQALCTANYRTGGDVNDFLHMWINYQLEHHLFPDLPMSAYRRIQPEVRALCEKHGVPYVQEGLLVRFGKLLDICTGAASVPRWVPATLASTAPAD